jgi:hypothetical protein
MWLMMARNTCRERAVAATYVVMNAQNPLAKIMLGKSTRR